VRVEVTSPPGVPVPEQRDVGRDRHLVRLLQDRDGDQSLLLESYLRTPVRFVFADGGFAGRLIDCTTQILCTTVHIVRKPADQRGFAVIPRR